MTKHHPEGRDGGYSPRRTTRSHRFRTVDEVSEERPHKHKGLSPPGQSVGINLGAVALLALGMKFIVGTPFWAVFLCGMFASWAMKSRSWWWWIPSGIFGISALDHSGVHLGGVGLPVLFIAAGVLVIAHDHIWAPARKVGLVIIGLLMLAALFNGDENRERNRTVNVNRPAISSTAPKSSVIPPLNGRRLVVIARDGEVTIEGQAGITEAKTNKMLIAADRGDRVEVTIHRDEDVTLLVPATTPIEVIERDGDVRIKGVTGNITVTGRDGDIRLDLLGDPTVDLMGDDRSDFELVGYEKDEAEGVFHHTGSGPNPQMVKVIARSADVFVTRKELVLR